MRKLFLILILFLFTLSSCTVSPEPSGTDLKYPTQIHNLNEKYEYMDDYFMITSSSFEIINNILYMLIDVDTTITELLNYEITFYVKEENKRKYIDINDIDFNGNQLILTMANTYLSTNEVIDFEKILTLSTENYLSYDETNDILEIDAQCILGFDHKFETYDEVSEKWVKHYFCINFKY